MAGCAGPIDGPRDRRGSLPFPGVFTRYHPADPNDLGTHRYGRVPRMFGDDELGHGIIYATRAGFIDVAHVRITIDTVHYCTDQLRDAIDERREAVKLTTIEGSEFVVQFHYPDDWPTELKSANERRIADELALRSGQRIAYLMMMWHEVITWFGYRTVMLVDESPSAFLYDDTMSHIVGLRVTDRVMRDASKPRSYDDAVTIALRVELAELGAVSPAETEQAARAVEGVWWAHGKPLKRQLDSGLIDGHIQPWLVRDKSAPSNPQPETFRLPTLADVYGRDFSDFYTVSIKPNVAASERMRQALPEQRAWFSAETDLPLLVEATRHEMHERLAVDVDQPWPGPVMMTNTTAVATTRPAVVTKDHVTLAPAGLKGTGPRATAAHAP